MAPPLSQGMNTSLSYPALHGTTGYFGPVFHTGPSILGVPSLCSFNSVANFMSWNIFVIFLLDFLLLFIKDFLKLILNVANSKYLKFFQ